MSMTAAEIGRVVEALERDLVGAVVRQVYSPAARDRVVIELRAPGANHFLQIVTMAGSSRIGRVEDKPPAAPAPHPFVMLLRGEIGGLVVQRISQLVGDRVVVVDLGSGDRTGALICELTSRHANIFWIDGSALIGGSFYPNRSHKRPLVPGEPYEPPLPRSPRGELPAPRFEGASVLEAAVEEHYREWESEAEKRGAAARVARLANGHGKRIDRLLGKIGADRKRAAEGERLAELGHLLKANLGLARRGMERLEVVDFTGDDAVIPLDPRLGPVENMERLYDRSKRLRRALPGIEEREARARADREWIGQLIEEIGGAEIPRLADIERELNTRFPAAAGRRQGKSGKRGRLPYREYAVAGGRAARVGRSARDNDTLTLRHARPDDLWLHVRGRPGSHVVVPLGRGEDPTAELLVDAAHLAVHFSEAKGEDDVEVIHTRRRYVQKPKGAAPGSVRLLKEKTILLRVEQDRLARLLGR